MLPHGSERINACLQRIDGAGSIRGRTSTLEFTRQFGLKYIVVAASSGRAEAVIAVHDQSVLAGGHFEIGGDFRRDAIGRTGGAESWNAGHLVVRSKVAVAEARRINVEVQDGWDFERDWKLVVCSGSAGRQSNTLRVRIRKVLAQKPCQLIQRTVSAVGREEIILVNFPNKTRFAGVGCHLVGCGQQGVSWRGEVS